MKKEHLNLLVWNIIIITIVCISSLLCVAINPSLYPLSNSILASPGDRIIVPIYIKNNPGIMGIHVVVEYPEELLSPIVVERGECLEQGIMNDSIGKNGKGSLDIVWSNSENISKDGLLFEMTFNVLESATGKGDNIRFACVDEDTFNENWEAVPFNSEMILITVSDAGSSKTETLSEDESSASPSSIHEDSDASLGATKHYEDQGESTDRQTIERILNESVQEVLEEQRLPSILDVPEDQRDSFVQAVKTVASEKTRNVLSLQEDKHPPDSSDNLNVQPTLSEENMILDVKQYENIISAITFDKLTSLNEESSIQAGLEAKPKIQITMIVLASFIIIALAVIAIHKKTKQNDQEEIL